MYVVLANLMRFGRLRKALTVAAGLALLGWAIAAVGPATAVAQLLVLGPILPLILVLAGLRYVIQAAAWRLAMSSETPPTLWRLTTACVIGETAGYLTFAGPFASVPARALLLRGQTPGPGVVAGAALERVFFVASGAAMVVVASAMVAWGKAGKATTWASLALVVATALAIVGGVLGATAAILVTSRRWLTTPLRSRRTWPALFCLGAGQHALALVEACLMLYALGSWSGLRRVFVFEALMKLVNVPATFVPAGVGVYESGSTLVAEALRLGAASGLAVGLMRRVRALIFSAVGLLWLALWTTDAGTRDPC